MSRRADTHTCDWKEENGRTICRVQGCLPRGRPRVLQGLKLTSVKMGADHWERLTELAQAAGCSRAEWLRRAITRG